MDLKLKNLETGKQINFLENPDYVIQEIDFGQAKRKSNVTQYINLLGYAVESTAFEPRDIVITGHVIENLKEAKKALNKLINPMHDILITNGNYTIKARPDMSIKYAAGYEANNRQLCKFVISLTAYIPLFELRTPKIYYEKSIKPVPLFPLKIPRKKGVAFGYVPAISINNIDNIGDVKTGFVIQFTAKEGEVYNPKITNNKTGEHIEIAVHMSKGDIVKVSTVSGDKYAKLIRGGVEVDIFSHITKKSTMGLTLNVGINDLIVTAAKNESNMNVVIIYTPQWTEVQE